MLGFARLSAPRPRSALGLGRGQTPPAQLSVPTGLPWPASRAPSGQRGQGGISLGSAGSLPGSPSIPVSPTLFQESCYGQFIKDFISTLTALLRNCNHDDHLQKVYKNMKELPRICTKLQVSSCLLLGEPETSLFCYTARGPVGQRASSGPHLSCEASGTPFQSRRSPLTDRGWGSGEWGLGACWRFSSCLLPRAPHTPVSLQPV